MKFGICKTCFETIKTEGSKKEYGVIYSHKYRGKVCYGTKPTRILTQEETKQMFEAYLKHLEIEQDVGCSLDGIDLNGAIRWAIKLVEKELSC